MISLIHIHLFFISVALGCVVFADHLVINWMRGKIEVLDKRIMARIHTLVWLSLLGIISTGSSMVYVNWEYYLTHPPFLVKMGFVSMLVLNACLIGRVLRLITAGSFRSLSSKTKTIVLFSGIVSTVGWLGALITAKIFL